MAEECNAVAEAAPSPPTTNETNEVPQIETKLESEPSDNVELSVINESADNKDDSVTNKDISVGTNDESGVVLDGVEVSPVATVDKDTCTEQEPSEVNDDARSLGDLDSLPAGDELALGAAGSDSGVEGCGRALSSGGGSRSCASSVVSCGSGCGSESSSLAGAPPRPRRRVNVVTETKRSSPVGTSTPRPVTAPRGPNLATRERARSREKPTPPEKPRPLTPKPRIRPTTDLPNLIRESPALRAKPTKTSTARCRTPSSPSEEKRWPTNGQRLPTTPDSTAARITADKYGTLPRRRRDEADNSPKHDSTPPSSRRPTVTRSVSSRTVKTRVRIYAEKTSQTVLLGSDIESALGGIVPNIETRIEVTKCHRGVQASGRDAENARAAAASAAQEKAQRLIAEAALAEERNARHAVLAELERNSQRLLELAGAAGAGAGAEGCLRALEDQLKAAGELATRHRTEIDALRDQCNRLHADSCTERERARLAEARLLEAEREAAEMQDFLAAETNALTHSLKDAEADAAKLQADLDKSRAECRQLVRMCEQRRQEALCAAARARGGAGAARALDAMQRRLARLTRAVLRAYRLPRDALEPTVYHNDVYSRSDSGEALSPEEEPRTGLLGAVIRAFRSAPAAAQVEDDRSRVSDDNDNSADLLDSETEPCFVNDPELAEEWWSGAEGAGAWSGDELSPERDSCPDIDKEAEEASVSERDSLRNLSLAITQRQRSEAEDERGWLLARVAALDARVNDLLAALRLAAAAPADDHQQQLALALRSVHTVTQRQRSEAEDERGWLLARVAALDARVNDLLAALRLAAAAPADDHQQQLALALRSVHTVTQRQRSEAEDERGWLLARVAALDARVNDLLAALRLAAAAPADDHQQQLALALRSVHTVTQRQRSEAEDERGWLLARVAALDARVNDLLAALRLAAAAPADDHQQQLALALRSVHTVTQRQRSEAEDERGWLLARVAALDARVNDLLAALRLAAAAPADDHQQQLALALRDKIDVTERNVADVVVKKLAELDATKNMMEHYRTSVETLKKQLEQSEEDDLEFLEEELASCSEGERRQRYEALDAALSALSGASPLQWPRLASLHAKLERIAFALAAPPPQSPLHTQITAPPLHTTA